MARRPTSMYLSLLVSSVIVDDLEYLDVVREKDPDMQSAF